MLSDKKNQFYKYKKNRVILKFVEADLYTEVKKIILEKLNFSSKLLSETSKIFKYFNS